MLEIILLLLIMSLSIVFSIGILIFSLVFLCGPPYMPTKRQQCQRALVLLNLQENEIIYDLGCGDGVMLLEAARSGLKAVGFEINPILYWIAKWRTRHYRHQVQVKWANFWRIDLSPANGLYVFLIDPYMKKLEKLINNTEHEHLFKVVSFNFKLPNMIPVKEQDALYLYHFLAK